MQIEQPFGFEYNDLPIEVSLRTDRHTPLCARPVLTGPCASVGCLSD